MPFLSRPSADQGSQNDRCLAPSDVNAARQFLKDLKSDEGEISTDASRMTTAINVALFADQLQQKNDVKRMEAADSVKTRPTEDNASSETSSTRKPKPKRVSRQSIAKAQRSTSRLLGTRAQRIWKSGSAVHLPGGRLHNESPGTQGIPHSLQDMPSSP